MQDAYASIYSDLYENHWWWRARRKALVAVLRKAIPPSPANRILDVGCGDGLFFDDLRAFGEPSGVEPEARLVTDKGRSRGSIFIGSFERDFLDNVTFNLITMLDVLEHVENDKAFLSKAFQLLGKGGLVLITVPALNCLWTRHDELNKHLRRYKGSDLMALASDIGFQPLLCRYLFLWTVPIKWSLSRFGKVLPLEPRQEAVPPAWLNRLLTELTVLECRLALQVPFPLGSSLLLLAQKK